MKLLILLCFYATCVHSANILGVFFMPTFSHFTPGQTLMNELVDRGHEVSVIAPYDDKASKFKTIFLSGMKEKMDAQKEDWNMFDDSSLFNNYFTSVWMLHQMVHQLMHWTMEHENVKNLLKSNQQFDVVIIDQFANDALHGFCHHYNASCIAYSALPTNYWMNPSMRNPENPAHMAQFNLQAELPMNFCARVLNTLMLGFQSFLYNVWIIPSQNGVMLHYFPNSPHLRDLIYETDLILLNSHWTFSEAGPLVPGMVEIGGFHLKQAGKLPEEFKKYLDASKEGVILFSMGSVLVGAELPPEKRQILINVFKKLKVNVLWKFEEDIQGLPSNVKTAKWIPQKEVLAHPNVKLFITHGGLSSTVEAVNYGVPVVGIPIFGDQAANMRVMESKGLGVKVDFRNLNEADLFESIQTVLNNKEYSQSAKKLSQLLNDRPMKAIDTATYWIEHIIKYKGGKHLKSSAMNLYWYEYMMIDVVAFLAIVAAVSLWISCFIIRKIFRRKKSSKTVAKISKSKKNK